MISRAISAPSTPERAWSITFHAYTAYFVLSYGLKSLYFMLSDDPGFVLWRYPRLDDIPLYSIVSSIIALAFWLLTWSTYRRVQRWLTARPVSTVEAPTDTNLGPAVVGLIAIALFFAQNWSKIVTKFTSSTILVRSMVASSDDYESGALGVIGLIGEFEMGLVVCLTAYCMLQRKFALLTMCALFFVGQAIVSDGSRFSLLSAGGFIPVLYYTVHMKKPEHRRWLYPAIYALVFALPFLAAPLLLVRSESRLPTYAGSGAVLARAGLQTFDSLDHLINYLYYLPIDFTGRRALEEFLYLVPRAIYKEKPFLYAINGLQEVVYPGSIGPEHRHHLYGMYPLGCITMALDMIGPVGFIVHGCGIGAVLALFDSWISGRSFTRHAMFAMNALFLYHMVRSGVLHYMIGGLGGCFLPALLASQASRVGRMMQAQAAPKSQFRLNSRTRDRPALGQDDDSRTVGG